jgi:hypothetical protein
MAGLYPENTMPVYDWISAGSNATGYKITNLTQSNNFITRLNEKSCPLFGKIYDEVTHSKDWVEARQYYYTTYEKKMV